MNTQQSTFLSAIILLDTSVMKVSYCTVLYCTVLYCHLRLLSLLSYSASEKSLLSLDPFRRSTVRSARNLHTALNQSQHGRVVT